LEDSVVIHSLRVIFFCILLAGVASSAPITFNFTGSITSVPIDNVFGDVGFGTVLSGSFTFDSATADGAPADPTTGSYSHVGAPYLFTVDIGGHVFTADQFFNVAVLNAFVDQYSAFGLAQNLSLEILLQDNTATVFNSDALPTAAPPLSSFTFGTFRLTATFDEGEVQYEGVLDSLTGGDPNPIPEPSSFWLAITGAGLWRARRFLTSHKQPARQGRTVCATRNGFSERP
jgi:hypothetical protein